MDLIQPRDGSWSSPDELFAVTAFLRPLRGGAPAVDIVVVYRLGVVVVISALNVLIEKRLVSRRLLDEGTAASGSTFALTAAGRRGELRLVRA